MAQEDLRKLRAPLLNAVYALEYFYVPVVECLVHARVALCPLGEEGGRSASSESATAPAMTSAGSRPSSSSQPAPDGPAAPPAPKPSRQRGPSRRPPSTAPPSRAEGRPSRAAASCSML